MRPHQAARAGYFSQAPELTDCVCDLCDAKRILRSREERMSEAEVALVLVIVGFVALLISIASPIDMSR